MAGLTALVFELMCNECASRARSILPAMLPLTSKMAPTETGGSSLEKWLDFLPLLALEDVEVLFIQPGDLAVQRIHDRH